MGAPTSLSHLPGLHVQAPKHCPSAVLTSSTGPPGKKQSGALCGPRSDATSDVSLGFLRGLDGALMILSGIHAVCVEQLLLGVETAADNWSPRPHSKFSSHSRVGLASEGDPGLGPRELHH